MERNDEAFTRLAAMLDFIAVNPGISVEEFSKHFGCQEDEARSAIEALIEASEGDGLLARTFFFDVAAYEELGFLRVSDSVAVGRQISLTKDQALLLVAGLEANASLAPDEELEKLPELSAKILALANWSEDAAGMTFERVAVKPGLLGQIRRAINDDLSMEIEYFSRKGRSKRRVDPIEVYQVEDGWVFDAWCHLAGAIRTFRLDRVRNATTTQFPRDPDVKIRRGRGAKCVVVLNDKAEWRLPDLPANTLVRRKGNTLVITLRVFDRAWLIGKLLWMAEDIVTVTPKEYLDEACKVAGRALETWKESV